jgi:hypothetical protein
MTLRAHVSAALILLALASAAHARVKVYKAGPIAVAEFKKAKCTLKKGRFVLTATAIGNHADMHLQIKDWKGYGSHYVFRYGQIHPGSAYLQIDADDNSPYGNAFPPPTSPVPLHIAGAVAFRHHGAIVALTMALVNSDYSASRLVKGTMPCARG